MHYAILLYLINLNYALCHIMVSERVWNNYNITWDYISCYSCCSARWRCCSWVANDGETCWSHGAPFATSFTSTTGWVTSWVHPSLSGTQFKCLYVNGWYSVHGSAIKKMDPIISGWCTLQCMLHSMWYYRLFRGTPSLIYHLLGHCFNYVIYHQWREQEG